MAGEKVRVLDFDQSAGGSQDLSQDDKEKLTHWRLNQKTPRSSRLSWTSTAKVKNRIESGVWIVDGKKCSKTEKIILLATKVDELDSFDPNGGNDLLKEVEKKSTSTSDRSGIRSRLFIKAIWSSLSVWGDIVNKGFSAATDTTIS